MEIQFVRATNADREAVHRIVDGALREHGLELLLHSSDADLDDLELHYDARGGRFELLLGPNGQAVGVFGWRPAEGSVVELKKLYLAAAARGQGLGRLALERVVAEARALGARAVVLETSALLESANRLYSRFGFVPVKGAAAASFACLSEQCDLAYRLDLAGAEKRNILFVCSRNQWRSPTAEAIFRRHPSLAVRSAGISSAARHKVSADDIVWADVIFVMEAKHKSRLVADFRNAIGGRTLHVLDIPDEYKYMDPELVEMLKESVTALLGLD